jgi:hypothetical protein
VEGARGAKVLGHVRKVWPELSVQHGGLGHAPHLRPPPVFFKQLPGAGGLVARDDVEARGVATHGLYSMGHYTGVTKLKYRNYGVLMYTNRREEKIGLLGAGGLELAIKSI